MICVGFGLTSALLCIKIFFFPFSRTDSQTPNLSQYVLLISLVYYKGGDELCTTYWYVMMIKKS